MKRIFVLVNKYPNILEPNVCVFIQQLIWAFADYGYECNVIMPLPVNLNFKYIKFPKKIKEITENGNVVNIYYPKYLSMGQRGNLLQKLRIKFTTYQYTRACNRVLKKFSINNKEDILYSHFICPSGVAAAILGKKYKMKSYMAYGEATYLGDSKYGNKYLKKVFQHLTGVIAVSSQNKDYLIDADVIEKEKIKIFPNGYRKERFFKIEKNEARNHFGWDENMFIVGFCGKFCERKGINRLEKAVNKLDDVYLACAGNGRLAPSSKKCILKESIDNNELVYFYNAIDVFVLPTQNEGCCNALVEAIACECPIISSDCSFNYDILDDSNSILINPNNIEEIKDAIIKIKNNETSRINMSKSSHEKSKELTMEKRAKNIIEFISK